LIISVHRLPATPSNGHGGGCEQCLTAPLRKRASEDGGTLVRASTLKHSSASSSHYGSVITSSAGPAALSQASKGWCEFRRQRSSSSGHIEQRARRRGCEQHRTAPSPAGGRGWWDFCVVVWFVVATDDESTAIKKP